ncbi:hypothetical protein GCM10022222_51020 [Amycolatopsis ultiminotia]|uniref:Cupin type-1 domain-containing protein n=1 Tax=Amycolatopsis ultiminotia TaxID=543629 RepID=A0ABP6X3V0_9PSEU
MTTSAFAVHCRPNGSEAQLLPEGGVATHVLYAPPVPVRGLSATRVLLPGGRIIPPQRHPRAETALVALSGYQAVLSGHTMAPIKPAPGDVVYIPPGIPYSVINVSHNAAVIYLAITTDPEFDNGAVPAPEYSGTVADQTVRLRTDHLARINSKRASGIRRRRR